MPITALDESTVKLITTTQVITSVCTATKELIENALDAGCSNVEISLAGHGASQIEVKDDGSGISKVDVQYMALPSFTSKISNFQDLDVLDTYGFRGEALCALCAIADVTITTKTVDDDTATSYTLNSHGTIVKSERCHGTVGTTVQVNDIFKRVPVRRQIVMDREKAKQDVKLLESLIKGFSICKPHVRFVYRVNGGTVFMKPRTNSIKDSVSYVLGRKIVSNMEWIDSEDIELTIKLLVPSRNAKDLSELCRMRQDLMFVNDRSIKNKDIERLMEKTISEYFAQKMPMKKKLTFLLYTLIDSNNIDVNLEPNKTAVFFKDKEKIMRVLEKLLKDYYGIPVEEPVVVNDSLDTSKPYNDYTQETNSEPELPAPKKRKIDRGGKAIEINQALKDKVERVLYPEEIPPTRSDNSNERKKSERKFSINQLEGPNLSEEDSNDAMKHDEPITVGPSSNGDLPKMTDLPIGENEANESLTQLPIVDLGEDFDLDSFTTENKKEEENKKEAQVEECKKDVQVQEKKVRKSYTLEEWSKGHVLKGGTDVIPYMSSDKDELCSQYNYAVDESICEKSTRKGFLEYSKEIRPQLLKENSNMSAVDMARKLITMWKDLSSQERGMYRDQADEEKANRKVTKQKGKCKENDKVDIEKSRKKFLEMFERAKNKGKGKHDGVMRTIVPWEIDLKRVTESFEKKLDTQRSTLVVGSITNNLWIIQNTSQLWLLDISRIKSELTTAAANIDQSPTLESVEKRVKQWLLEKEDLSMMHPIHSLDPS